MNKVELHQAAMSYLESKYNIKYACDCRDFDLEPQLLLQKLSAFQGLRFDVQDKILLVHMDTDYYDTLLPFGLIPINVIRVFTNLDLPLHALLFVTNHFGIKKEFDFLLKDRHPADRPKIVETVLSRCLLPPDEERYPNVEFDQIEKNSICMMNRLRSHRIALYNFLSENNLQDKIALCQNFNA